MISEKIKRVVAVIMTVIILTSSNSIVAFADSISNNAAQEINVTKENTINAEEVQIEGTDSFGELFSETMEAEINEVDQGFSIFSVKVSNKIATVTYCATEVAELVVGIYDEKGDSLLAVGTFEVSSEGEIADVPIEIDTMPQYFYIRAYMVDTETLAPLCKVYDSPNYTQEMQEFLKKTINDFTEDKVYNLDSDFTNNFAVFNNDVVVKEENNENNILSYVNNEEKKYIIDNADDDIKNLTEGDIYAYETIDGILIIKVSNIEVDNTQVILYGSETNLEEVFDYIKIDTTAGMENATLDASDADASISYNGVGEKVTKTEGNVSENNGDEDIFPDEAWEGNLDSKSEFKFGLFKENMVSGNIGMDVGVGMTYYLSSSYQSIDIYFNVNINFELKTYSNLDEFKPKLGKVKLPVLHGINVAFVVYFNLKGDVSLTLEGSFKTKLGVSYNSDTGAKDIKELKPQIEVNVDGEIFIGLVLNPQVEIISEKIGYIGGEVNAGIKIKGSKALFKENASKDEIHRCLVCFDGDITAVFSFALNGKLLNTNKLSIKVNIASLSYKLQDWYFSEDLQKFGFGTCPNRSMKVTVNVQDKKNRLIDAGEVVISQKKDKKIIYTGKLSNGIIETYLEQGNYIIGITASGYKSIHQEIKIEKKRREIVVKLDLLDQKTNFSDNDNKSKNDYSIYDEISSINQTFRGNIKQIKVGHTSNLAIITNNDDLYIVDSVLFPNDGDAEILVPHKMMENVKKIIIQDHNAGERYAAILTDGSLYTWGYDFDDSNKVYKIISPKKILNAIKDIAIGANHYVALAEDGTLYTWGKNDCGQLGTGKRDNIIHDTPQSVLKGVKAIAAGRNTTYAVLTNGDLYYVGNELDIKYWNSSMNSSTYTTKFSFYTNNIAKVSTDNSYNILMLISTDNKLYTVGNTGSKELENYNEISKYSIHYIMDNIVKADGTGNSYSAIDKNGDLYIWGDITNSAQPQKIMGNIEDADLCYLKGYIVDKKGYLYYLGMPYEFGNYMQIASRCKDLYLPEWGNYFGYITQDGDLYMYGENTSGMLGNGTNEDNLEYTCILHNAEQFVDIHSSSKMGAITEKGELYMWGEDFSLVPQKVANNILEVSGSYLVTKDYDLYHWWITGSGEFKMQKKASEVKQYAGFYQYYPYYVKNDNTLRRKKDYGTEQIVATHVKKAIINNSAIAYLSNDNRLYISEQNNGYKEIIDDVEDFIFVGGGYSSDRDYAIIAIKRDNTLWAWGNNSNRQLTHSWSKSYYNSFVQIYDHVSKIKASVGQMSSYPYGFITDIGDAYIFPRSTPLNAYKFPTKINTDYYLAQFSEIEEIENNTAFIYGNEDDILVDNMNNATINTVTQKADTEEFNNLIPNVRYNYYIVSDMDEGMITNNNLIYIAQKITDDNGKVCFSYQTSKDISKAKSFVIPMSCDEVEKAEGTLTSSISENEEVVKLEFNTDSKLQLVEFSIVPKGKDGVKTVWIKARPEQKGKYTAELPMKIYDYEKGLYEVAVIGEDYFMNRGIIAKLQFEITKDFLIVKYILNDDTFSPATNSKNNLEKYEVTGTRVTMQPAMRKGYDFLGWYSDKHFTKKADSISVNEGGKIVLYAKWKEQQTKTDIEEVPKPTVSQKPAGEESRESNSDNPLEKVKVGSKISISQEKAVYKVTKCDNINNAVTYLETTDKSKKHVVIPDYIVVNGVRYKVTAVGKNAFKGCKKLQKVVVGINVIAIGDHAFEKCSSLKSIKFPAKLKTIGNYAFKGCKKLKSITLGKKITKIGKSAFQECTSLKKIVIPASVQSIGKKAFFKCRKLGAITIKSKKLKTVGSSAFKSIKKGASVKVLKKYASDVKERCDSTTKVKGVNLF